MCERESVHVSQLSVYTNMCFHIIQTRDSAFPPFTCTDQALHSHVRVVKGGRVHTHNNNSPLKSASCFSLSILLNRLDRFEPLFSVPQFLRLGAAGYVKCTAVPRAGNKRHSQNAHALRWAAHPRHFVRGCACSRSKSSNI